MKHTYDLYGWLGASLDEAVHQVQELLDVRLEARESSYRGGDYYRWEGQRSEELILQHNFVDDDGHVVEKGFERHKIIMYASRLNARCSAMLAQAPGLILLRSELL